VTKKTKYLLPVPVESVSGTQYWAVEATSPARAIAAFRQGQGSIVHEEIEVTALGEVDVQDVTIVDEEETHDENPFDWSNKSDEQIVAAGLELARRIYKAMGYEVPEGYKFYDARHPQEQGMWNIAVIAFEELTGTDLQDALANIEE
jgi:hypothetical protein